MARKRIANMNVHYYRYSLSRFLEEQQRLGIHQVILWGSTPHFWVDHLSYENPKPIGKMLDQHGVELVAFAPRPYGYSLYHAPDSSWGQRAVGYYRNCILAAVELGTRQVIIEPEGALRDDDPATARAYLLLCLNELCHTAEQYGVQLILSAVERSVSAVMNTLPELCGMLEQLPSPHLKALLHLSPMALSGETVPQWFDALGERIVLVYLSDGRRSGEYAIGDGALPFLRYLKELEDADFNGPLGLKMSRDRYELRPFETDRQNLDALEALWKGCAADV